MSAWTLDLGTTHSAIACWDEDAERPHLLELPEICRHPGQNDPLKAPRMIPSAVQVRVLRGFWDRLGANRLFQRYFFWGCQGLIGRAALAQNEGWTQPSFAPGFKSALSTDPHRVLARTRGKSFIARDIARIFMRELLVQVQRKRGERIRELVITTPVESYDSYRAELMRIARLLGIQKLRFIDEPVAAALGYGLSLREDRRVLVVDFGGGTLDLAVVSLSAREMEAGQAQVLAKSGRPLGGDSVDQWILEEINARLELPKMEGAKRDLELWQGLMKEEARRIKERLHFEPQATFSITPPEEFRGFQNQMGAQARFLDFEREDLLALLKHRGLYDLLEDCCLEIEGQIDESLDEVLMVGGSTLLPQVYSFFENRYGRDRVRAWQPFEAVTFGACAFAADRFVQSDFVIHDYAILTFDPKNHERIYTPVIRKGTRFPTPMDFWKRQFVPTCSLGEPERIFKLIICEMASGAQEGLSFAWDAQGQLHRLEAGANAAPIVVPLNESNPGLGHLHPPHQPGDHSPRLEIGFGIDSNRWLCATVLDLKTRKNLMKAEPVVRLL